MNPELKALLERLEKIESEKIISVKGNVMTTMPYPGIAELKTIVRELINILMKQDEVSDR